MTQTDIAAKNIRQNILRLSARAGADGKLVHIAPSLSVVEILTVLITKIIKPQDMFVLSKGHAGLAYYAALKEAGFIEKEQLDSFETDGSDFSAHPIRNKDANIVFSSGSLGMGLSYACGLALYAKKNNIDRTVYVLTGDGELNEGSNWEAVMFARQQKLNNIVAVVDNNGMQLDGASKDIIDADWQAVFNAFGWHTIACDGHCTDDLTAALSPAERDAPYAVLAKTIKGKGVSFMENNYLWHHNILNDDNYQKAIREVESSGI